MKFKLHQEVRISPKEKGEIVGVSQYINAGDSYLVRYVAGDGRMNESWWSEDAIVPLTF